MKNPNPKARKVLKTLEDGTNSVKFNPSEENYRAWEGKIEKAGSSNSWGWILGVGLFLCVGGFLFSVLTAGVTTAAVTYREEPADNYLIPSSNSDNPSFSDGDSEQLTSDSQYVTETSEPQYNPVAKISCAGNLYYVNLRRTPGYTDKDDSTDSIYEVPCGEYVELLGDTQYVDSLTWWRVSWNGYTGWMADHTGSGKTILIFDQ